MTRYLTLKSGEYRLLLCNGSFELFHRGERVATFEFTGRAGRQMIKAAIEAIERSAYWLGTKSNG
jgi:hypothetical protein